MKFSIIGNNSGHWNSIGFNMHLTTSSEQDAPVMLGMIYNAFSKAIPNVCLLLTILNNISLDMIWLSILYWAIYLTLQCKYRANQNNV